MPTFDVVSRLEFQEVDNAIANSMKEVGQRYDFKGSSSKIVRNDQIITLTTEDELKAKQVIDLLTSHMIKRKIDPKAIKLKNSETATGNSIRQTYNLVEGIDQEIAKKITTLVKSTKLKVQAKIQGSELRISGGKRDDLQQIIQQIMELNLDIPLQFVNFRD